MFVWPWQKLDTDHHLRGPSLQWSVVVVESCCGVARDLGQSPDWSASENWLRMARLLRENKIAVLFTNALHPYDSPGKAMGENIRIQTYKAVIVAKGGINPGNKCHSLVIWLVFIFNLNLVEELVNSNSSSLSNRPVLTAPSVFIHWVKFVII